MIQHSRENKKHLLNPYLMIIILRQLYAYRWHGSQSTLYTLGSLLCFHLSSVKTKNPSLLTPSQS
jgi:hypothetical protein